MTPVEPLTHETIALILHSKYNQDLCKHIKSLKTPIPNPLEHIIYTLKQAGIYNLTLISTADCLPPDPKILSHAGVDFWVVDKTNDSADVSENISEDDSADVSANTSTQPATQVSNPFFDVLSDFAQISKSTPHQSPTYQRYLIIPDDAPFISLFTIQTLLSSEQLPVIPSYQGTLGLPILLDQTTFDHLTRHPIKNNLHQAIQDLKIQTHVIEVNDDGILKHLTEHGVIDRSTNTTHDSTTYWKDFISKRGRPSMYPVSKLMICGTDIFFGPGAYQLVKLIAETHNVRRASQRMNISYSKAWKIIKTIQAQMDEPLLNIQHGGHNGGQVTLTETGQAFLTRYEQYTAACHDAIQKCFQAYYGDLIK